MIDFQLVLQEYQSKGHILKRQLSTKPECSVCLMQSPEGKLYILRICHKPIEAYTAITGHFCPNLPQVFKTCEVEGLFVVEEEYIDGISLWEMISGGARMDEERVARIAVQICKGLSFLHQTGFVHRDIKPENMMLTPDEIIYIIDLDASMRINRYKESDTTLLGTAMYAAPEQFGLTRSDERTDIYAVGILINELLTGVHPAVETYRKGLLGNVIEKCTRMNPADRYRSADELQRALELAVPTEGSVSEASVMQAQPETKQQPKKRMYMLAVLILVFALAAGAAALKGFLGGDFEEEKPSEGVPSYVQTEYDKDGHTLLQGTDYIQLYKENRRDTVYLNPVGGTQSAPLFTEDGIRIDTSYDVYADEAVGYIVKWDTRYNGWMLSSEQCQVGSEGYLHAEKDGKHYAILVKVVGSPMGAYSMVPDISDIGGGYLAEGYSQEIFRGDIVSLKYKKGKPFTIYLVAQPNFKTLNPACDNPFVSIKKYEGRTSWPAPVFEMTYKNPEGGSDVFTVTSEYYNLEFYFSES